MAVKVRKVAELIGNEIVCRGDLSDGSVGNFATLITNFEEHIEGNSLLERKIGLEIGIKEDKRFVIIDLPQFINSADYEQSFNYPTIILNPNSPDNYLYQCAIFRNKFYIICPAPRHQSMIDEAFLRIKRDAYAEEAEFTSLKSYVANIESAIEYQRNGPKRDPISDDVKMVVWARDGGACTRCGAREKLHFDHVIPVAKGGSNLAENIQLLC